ncbi:MAG TPA: S8 family serine peptidase, partial [Burkholderiaceae bacterium]|nr:S8 family serine peptidase [Burkholderiaceae bacterium]
MSRFPPRALALAAAAATLLAAVPARAQLRLPGLPALPGTVLPAPTPPSPRLAELLPGDVPLQELRARLVRDLLRERGSRLETDPAGEPVVRGELVVAAPTDPFLVAARAQGFRVLREQTLEGLDLRSAVLAAPEGMATAQALARLRALDPAAQVDYQHVYLHGGAVEPAAAPDRTAASTDVPVGAGRVGLVDGGVEHDHPALRGAELRVWGCGGQRWPSVHGTAVASLLVGRDRAFRGAMPHAILYAADVYCGQDTGGSVEAVVQALAWMARERVAVVNVSLVGAPNRL